MAIDYDRNQEAVRRLIAEACEQLGGDYENEIRPQLLKWAKQVDLTNAKVQTLGDMTVGFTVGAASLAGLGIPALVFLGIYSAVRVAGKWLLPEDSD